MIAQAVYYCGSFSRFQAGTGRAQRPSSEPHTPLAPMRLALPAVPSTGDNKSSNSKREPRWWSGWAWGQAAPARAAAAAPPLPATPQPQPESPVPLAAAASLASHPLESPRPVASSQRQTAVPSDPLTLLEWHGEAF